MIKDLRNPMNQRYNTHLITNFSDLSPLTGVLYEYTNGSDIKTDTFHKTPFVSFNWCII